MFIIFTSTISVADVLYWTFYGCHMFSQYTICTFLRHHFYGLHALLVVSRATAFCGQYIMLSFYGDHVVASILPLYIFQCIYIYLFMDKVLYWPFYATIFVNKVLLGFFYSKYIYVYHFYSPHFCGQFCSVIYQIMEHMH